MRDSDERYIALECLKLALGYATGSSPERTNQFVVDTARLFFQFVADGDVGPDVKPA